MIGDPYLNYFALGILFFVVIVLFYGIIAIHDIPHIIAKSRNHPHQDAIHAAGWVSLFTLHALWPFLWIWAMAYRPDRGWGIAAAPPAATADIADDHARLQPSPDGLAAASDVPAQNLNELNELKRRIAEIEAKLAKAA